LLNAASKVYKYLYIKSFNNTNQDELIIESVNLRTILTSTQHKI